MSIISCHSAGRRGQRFVYPPCNEYIGILLRGEHSLLGPGRGGYRNIAQYRTFMYDDYRGGRDGAHDSKTVGVQEWLGYWEERFPRPVV